MYPSFAGSKMRRSIRVAAVAALLSIAAAPLSGQYAPPERQSAFELLVGQQYDPDGRTVLVLGATVPYRRLVFFRTPGGFRAYYRVYMDLRDRKGRQVRGDVWEEELGVESYDETRAPAVQAVSRRTFDVPPGEYTARVTIEVIGTDRRFYRERRIRMLGRKEGRLELGDPVFYSPVGPAAEPPPGGEIAISVCDPEGDGRFEPNNDGVYAGLDSWPRIAHDMIIPDPTDEIREYVISVRISEYRGPAILYSRKRGDITRGGHGRICLDLGTDLLSIGEYTVETAVEIPGTDERVTTKGRFTVVLGRGILVSQFDELLDILSLFADDEEIARLAAAAPEERMEAWRRFWLARSGEREGPHPADEGEFLFRLRHVMRNFSDHGAGWKSDRGRVWIRYGRPDDIREGSDRAYGRGYLAWYYFNWDIMFLFEDSIGTGDYRLLESRPI